jgi:hypothetical protein
LNGGAMRIRSTLGVGTIVLVRLPSARPAPDEPSAMRVVMSDALH